jgi:chemotaxis protein methyltransferase CheR
MHAELDPLEVRLFLQAIYERYGYDFRSYTPASMERRVAAALARSGAPHLGELQHQLLVDPQRFADVLDALTVRVSSLFRDPQVFRTLRERVVPVLRTYPLIKVWHAGCATGEEVYATAILLAEEGLYDRAQLYATDLSSRALERASQGTYAQEEMQGFRENHFAAGGTTSLDVWCTSAYGGVAFGESLKRNILFFPHNLSSDYPFGEMHLVFCRNVLIYFAPELRQRVLETLAQSVCPGGFLCLGSSERLSSGERAGRWAEFAGEQRIYRYEGG